MLELVLPPRWFGTHLRHGATSRRRSEWCALRFRVWPKGIYEIDIATGDRSLVASDPSMGNQARFTIWPAPSYFPPTVAGLSIGGGALLMAFLAGIGLRAGRPPSDDP